MNGVHDMGGLQCFGKVRPDPDEPLFHAIWEQRVLAMSLAMGATGSWNLDQSRATRESLPPARYLSAGYYGIWLEALEELLVSKQLITREELAEGQALQPAKPLKRVLQADQVEATLQAGSPVAREPHCAPTFKVNDAVRVKNRHSPGHTRMPAYIRCKAGTVVHVHGCHVYPDSHATGAGEDPQWLYTIEFSAQELWGENSAPFCVNVDCWEPYLEVCE
ncbi:MAG: nitrile hydratase subunit beta [Granulosicoccus sp.]